MYSQEEINKAIIYKHRLSNRLMEVLKDIQVLDKPTLLAMSDKELIQLGLLLLPVYNEMLRLKQNHPVLAKELDNKAENSKR
jgi:hypothetical protein